MTSDSNSFALKRARFEFTYELAWKTLQAHLKTLDLIVLSPKETLKMAYQQGSDIDLAIDAPLMTAHEFAKLWNTLDDLPIIYSLDVIHLQGLKNHHLMDAIKREGIVLYDSSQT